MTADVRYPPIAIVGAGSWGTALAVLLGGNGRSVRLWPRRVEQFESLSAARENRLYLPGVTLPDGVRVCRELGDALSGAGVVIFAVPAEGIGDAASAVKPFLTADHLLLSAAKGLRPQTGERMSEILTALLPGRPVAALSGPNLAAEVAACSPTTTVVASVDDDCRLTLQQLLMCPTFRVYTNSDIIGVELAGALKNIIAIAAGISDGLGFGDNSKAALMTRGLAEVTRLGVAMGAQAETFRGLAGVGDLMATCASSRSRNHTVGVRLARGETLKEILASMDQIAEGVPTTRAASMLAARHAVEMPITAQLHEVLFEGVSPREGVARLMSRSGRDEQEQPHRLESDATGCA